MRAATNLPEPTAERPEEYDELALPAPDEDVQDVEYDDGSALSTLVEEDARQPEYDEVFRPDEEPALPVVRVQAPAPPFAYALGHRVQPAPAAPARTISWRRQLKERWPETGLVHRVNVYRLDDGFWDCYREDELHAA